MCVFCGYGRFPPLVRASVEHTGPKCDLLSLPGKQDKEDDIKVGVKSTALRFQGQTKAWLSGFAVAMMSGLTAAGINAGQTLPYYATLSTVAIHLVYQVRRLKRRGKCSSTQRWRFKVTPPPSLTDLHVGHQQTRGLLAEICLQPKPGPFATFRHCCWEFMEGKERQFAAE